MNKTPILFILFTILFFACKKPASVSVAPTEEDYSNIKVQEIDFEYFKSKSKITYQDATRDETATVDIRMRKDSIIWLSVGKLGFEGLRGLITRDSIFVLDKLNNEYLTYDFKSLSEKFNFTITFDLLQAAILGNLPIGRRGKDREKIIKDKDYYMLRQKNDSVQIDSYINAENLKLKKILVIEQASNNSLSLDYENFSLLNNFLFPYRSLISLKYKSAKGSYNTLVGIQHIKAEILDKELKFPFNVPQRFERK
jgi:hypothetical protein